MKYSLFLFSALPLCAQFAKVAIPATGWSDVNTIAVVKSGSRAIVTPDAIIGDPSTYPVTIMSIRPKVGSRIIAGISNDRAQQGEDSVCGIVAWSAPSKKGYALVHHSSWNAIAVHSVTWASGKPMLGPELGGIGLMEGFIPERFLQLNVSGGVADASESLTGFAYKYVSSPLIDPAFTPTHQGIIASRQASYGEARSGCVLFSWETK